MGTPSRTRTTAAGYAVPRCSFGVHHPIAGRAELDERQQENDHEQYDANGRRIPEIETLETLLIEEDGDHLRGGHHVRRHHLIEEVERLEGADRLDHEQEE